jgi:hypothetical protein
MNDRLFPARPILAVSAAVFRKGRVLILRRARAPLVGHFSLPGGASKSARQWPRSAGSSWKRLASRRRSSSSGGDHPRGDRVRAHFVIASFVAR